MGPRSRLSRSTCEASRRAGPPPSGPPFSLALRSEGHLQRRAHQCADLEDGESQDISGLIYLFHHLVALRFLEVARFLVKDDLQGVPFRVVPDPQSLPGHIWTPLFTRS